jgi:hypothetical protein
LVRFAFAFFLTCVAMCVSLKGRILPRYLLYII